MEGVDPAFDPKPLIRSFESLAEELNKSKKRLNLKIGDIEDQIVSSEKSRKNGFKEFTSDFEVDIANTRKSVGI